MLKLKFPYTPLIKYPPYFPLLDTAQNMHGMQVRTVITNFNIKMKRQLKNISMPVYYLQISCVGYIHGDFLSIHKRAEYETLTLKIRSTNAQNA